MRAQHTSSLVIFILARGQCNLFTNRNVCPQQLSSAQIDSSGEMLWSAKAEPKPRSRNGKTVECE